VVPEDRRPGWGGGRGGDGGMPMEQAPLLQDVKTSAQSQQLLPKSLQCLLLWEGGKW